MMAYAGLLLSSREREGKLQSGLPSSDVEEALSLHGTKPLRVIEVPAQEINSHNPSHEQLS